MAASCLVSVYEELMKRKLNSEEHKDVNKFGVPIIQLKDIKYLLIKYKKKPLKSRGNNLFMRVIKILNLNGMLLASNRYLRYDQKVPKQLYPKNYSPAGDYNC